MQFLALIQPRGYMELGKEPHYASWGVILHLRRPPMSSSGNILCCCWWKRLCCLYGGRPNEGLDVLRYRRFCEKVTTSNTTVQVQGLPYFCSRTIPRGPSLSSSATVDGKREKFKSRRLGMVKNSRPASCAHYWSTSSSWQPFESYQMHM